MHGAEQRTCAGSSGAVQCCTNIVHCSTTGAAAHQGTSFSSGCCRAQLRQRAPLLTRPKLFLHCLQTLGASHTSQFHRHCRGGGGGGKVPACQQAGRGVELPPVTSTAGAPAGSQARQRGSGSVDCRRKPVVTGSPCVIPLGWPLCARRLAARPSKAADPRLSPLPLLPWCGCSACASGPPCGSASQRGPRTSPCRTAGRQGGTRNRFESSVPVQSSTAWRGRLGAWGHRWRRSSMPTESSARNRASSLPAARRPASAPCCSRWCCPGSRSSSHPCRRAARCTGLLAGVGGAERRLREGVRV